MPGGSTSHMPLQGLKPDPSKCCECCWQEALGDCLSERELFCPRSLSFLRWPASDDWSTEIRSPGSQTPNRATECPLVPVDAATKTISQVNFSLCPILLPFPLLRCQPQQHHSYSSPPPINLSHINLHLRVCFLENPTQPRSAGT